MRERERELICMCLRVRKVFIHTSVYCGTSVAECARAMRLVPCHTIPYPTIVIIFRLKAEHEKNSAATRPLVVEVLLSVHKNRRLIRDGSPGRPPRLSHSS